MAKETKAQAGKSQEGGRSGKTGRPPTSRERIVERYPTPDDYFRALQEKGPGAIAQELNISRDSVKDYGMAVNPDRYRQCLTLWRSTHNPMRKDKPEPEAAEPETQSQSQQTQPPPQSVEIKQIKEGEQGSMSAVVREKKTEPIRPAKPEDTKVETPTAKEKEEPEGKARC